MRTKFSGFLTLVMAFAVQLTFAQEKTITGTVTDSGSGLPLAGVNIVIEGTSTGTQTDFDGNYSIQASEGQVLLFTYVGYSDQSMTVGADNTINVGLTQGAELEQVVISVLGQERKVEELTTSNEIVGTEELNQAANPDAVSALTGKVSGLNIRNTNSGINNDLRIVFRGQRSITGNNEALIVIDGVISSSEVLRFIDPNNIESVNAIKGANGAALYGSQGANGALIITTKKGTNEGKLNIRVNSTTTFRDIAYLPDRQTRYGQGWNGQHTSYENGGWGPEFTDNAPLVPVGLPLEDGSYRYFPYTPDKDNLRDFFQTGTTFQNSVTLSGGTMDEGYAFLSVNKVDKEFVVANDIADKTAITFRGGKRMGNWTIEGNGTYITSKTDVTGSTLLATGLYKELLQTATSIPVGEFNSTEMTDHWTAYYRNPNWIRENERQTNRVDLFTGIAKVGYKVNDNINILYNANIRTRHSIRRNTVAEYLDTENIGGGDFTTLAAFRVTHNTLRDFYGDLLVNYNYDLSDDFTLKGSLGNNISDARSSFSDIYGTPLTLPGFYNADNIEGAPDLLGNGYSRVRTFSLFGSASLGFRDYLYLEVTGRNDWTSVLHPDNRSFFYPSVGLSFVATDAIEGLEGDVLNFAKLSFNVAQVGNAGVGAYRINDLYVQSGAFPYGELNSFVPSTSAADPDLKNELITAYEGNLNLGFFKDRLTLDVSAFQQTVDDQIISITSSSASGIGGATQNIGKTESKGVEINLGGVPLKTDDFKWSINMFYSSNETIVKEVSPTASELAIATFDNFINAPVGIFAIEGEKFPAIKGSAYERDPQGRVVVDPTTGIPKQTADLQVLGYAAPDYTVGLNTTFSYKGLSLSATMDYRTGHQFFSETKAWLSWSGHLIESAVNGRSGFIYPNSSIEVSPGVYEANNSVLTGGPGYVNYLSYFSNDYYAVAENFVLDATAFKLREVGLSYTFPESMLRNTAFEGITLGIVGRNLLTVLPKENRGYNDPESSFTGNFNDNAQGVAVTTQYPVTRSYGFSVDLTF